MKKLFLSFLIAFLCTRANALEYQTDDWKFALDADGMVGFLEPKDNDPLFINDWDIKASATYNINETQRFGAVYSIDAESVEDNEYIHDAFVLFQDKNFGRAEFGITDSIARKMGLGLPDVGFLRINDKSILYKKLDLDNVFISDTTATTGHETVRLNLATTSTPHGQYGISGAIGNGEFNYAIDGAFKFKRPNGKLKTAYSLAVSYMDKPHGFSENSFSPAVYADWHGQIALGVNAQYNSFIWAASARLIYDENPVMQVSDGLVAGTGVSYDLLQYSLSLNYLFSDTNIFSHKDKITNEKYSGDYLHSLIASFRYKYSQNTALFMSAGFADTTPFFAVGIKSGF